MHAFITLAILGFPVQALPLQVWEGGEGADLEEDPCRVPAWELAVWVP